MQKRQQFPILERVTEKVCSPSKNGFRQKIPVSNSRVGFQSGHNVQSQFSPTFPALGVYMPVFEDAQPATKAAHRILRDPAFRVFCHQKSRSSVDRHQTGLPRACSNNFSCFVIAASFKTENSGFFAKLSLAVVRTTAGGIPHYRRR
jgi:hypothetical protein